MGERGEPSAVDWLARVGQIRVWQRDGERAPHKPLLILLALARLQQRGASEVTFAEVEPELRSLLIRFGPQRAGVNPEMPFLRLPGDGLWVLGGDALPAGKDATAKQAREALVTGRFVDGFEAELRSQPGLVVSIATYLLADNFPRSLHAEVCDAVGLDLVGLEVAAAEVAIARDRAYRLVGRRDPRFRPVVLAAYGQRCAMCGFGGLLAGQLIGVEAAHIRWHAAGGPDDVPNGLALCTMHHHLFDRGVLGVDDSLRIEVSSQYAPMGDGEEQLVVELHGRRLRDPQGAAQRPADEHVEWHRRQVFRDPARPAA